MPPHLHPRSKFTSSLFATTLFASFFVVGLPHILPCPAPRVVYADDGSYISADGRPRRRRRKCTTNADEDEERLGLGDEGEGKKLDEMDKPNSNSSSKFQTFTNNETCGEGEIDIRNSSRARKAKRECPVPKPGGIVGEILGFKSDGKGSKPP